MSNRVIQGNALEVYKELEPSSADLILTDPPYGNIKDLDWEEWTGLETDWDNKVGADEIIKIGERLLRERGKLITFSMEPLTTEFVKNATSDLSFSYKLIWEKNDFANALNVNTAPVNYYEELPVFSKEHDSNKTHPLRKYFSQVLDYIGLKENQVHEVLGHYKTHHIFTNGSQFQLCTKETYAELIEEFDIDEMDGFRKYKELKSKDDKYKSSRVSVFNLPPGQKYKGNILKYDRDTNKHHPTQKPIPLLEDLIKTYTNPGDLVIDPFAGSGSTAVAAQNTGREYIAIEQKEEYAQTAKRRLNKPQKTLEVISN